MQMLMSLEYFSMLQCNSKSVVGSYQGVSMQILSSKYF